MCFAISLRILVMLRIDEVGRRSALISGRAKASSQKCGRGTTNNTHGLELGARPPESGSRQTFAPRPARRLMHESDMDRDPLLAFLWKDLGFSDRRDLLSSADKGLHPIA